MQWYHCRCKETTSYGSMPPPRCLGCADCGTRLEWAPAIAAGGAFHPPEPHTFYTEMVETDEGPKPLTRCQWCLKTQRELQGGPDG